MLSFHTGDYKLIFHYIATPNIGGDIPIDVPTNQNIGGDTSPASPAGLTPMFAIALDHVDHCIGLLVNKTRALELSDIVALS